jgi:hypothetical protein
VVAAGRTGDVTIALFDVCRYRRRQPDGACRIRTSQVHVNTSASCSPFEEHHLTHPPTPRSPTHSHFLLRASGVVHLVLILPFLPIPRTCVPSHSGEFGAGPSQTWLSDKSH